MQNYQKGTFWRRFWATVIDSILIGVTAAVFASMLQAGSGTEGDGFDDILSSILGVVYAVVMIVHDGRTVGKRLMKLKVVSLSYGRVSWGSALLRESVGKFLSGIVLFLGYLTVLTDPKRRSWHDKLAKTYVVATDHIGSMIPVEDEVVTDKDKATFWILLVFGTFPFTLLLFLGTYLFLVQPHQIKGNSMEPNYHHNAYYLTDKLSYRFSEPQRGDTVVYHSSDTPDVDYFQRVVGLPGEEITFAGRKVYINGQLLVEPYLEPGATTFLFSDSIFSENQSVQIPENMYVVLGDNRGHSSDSREHGFVPRENIVGKMTICYWQCMGTRR